MKLLDACTYINNYQEFDYKLYASLGYNTLLLDIDNTLSPFYVEEPDDEIINFINILKENGFEVIIISNNTKDRVSKYVNKLNCKYYYMSLKPLIFTYLRIIKENNLDKSKIICLGDQLVTDILGGNILGLYTIYTKPIVNKDNFSGKITRSIERTIFKLNGKM